ncbi:hypothetical protein OBBRIDRAFT_787325 [Obba rivulosa]|uniref:SUZ domain-containing protein n=1 Tax=Obba rivulosa TaxID=1052685 RepID=A0A8E2DV66_9APHY|nr:hypothetical protein OBBRIDRAFT_787325 [Obba rivulosa]
MATAAVSASSATSSSASAPDIHSLRPPSESLIATSPSLDAVQTISPHSTPPESLLDVASSSDSGLGSTNADPDPQILEALRSKDRLYVLKLGEQMERLINERSVRIDLNPSTTYQRLLVHRCSAYYKLAPESDSTTKTIYVYYRAESRIPPRRISELVPVEESAQPTFKIMRRSAPDRLRSRQSSQPGSTAGEDADLSDIEPSEAGSIGGPSSTTSSTKRFRTIAEREAAYAEARERIFMNFEAKEKEKEKDMSANSSMFSLVSGSGSTSGGRGSSVGDIDDSASSAATESEWSGPVTRDRKDGRRSTRSVRSSGGSFIANGSGSSRDSRATSPSFSYPTLYEPPPGQYDVSYGPAPPAQGYMPYMYPYPGSPGQVPGQPYMPPYGYYVPYPYSPPHSSSHPTDPSNQTAADSSYSPQPPPVPYVPQYMWAQSSSGQPPSVQQPPLSQSPTNLASGQSPPHPPHATGPHAPPAPQYPAWLPAPGTYSPYTYPYHQPPLPYTNNDPPNPAQQHMQGSQYYMQDMQRPSSMPPGFANGNAPTVDGNNNRRGNGMNHAGQNGNSKRGMPRRQNWSYGPGAGNGGYTFNTTGLGGVTNEAVGPRLSNNNMRRISGASSGSGSAGTRTPGDEASSTTSSENSSSSRQTFTSTSSKHPLPARPDWAVGLKPHPNLHGPRHHDHSNPNSRTMSPARIGGQAHLPPQHQPQPVLQSTDFPPLSSAPERRMPTPGGAWTNSSSIRTVMTAGPPQGNAPSHGTALVHYPNSNSPGSQNRRADDQEQGFERPPPKANAELFNPKGPRQTAVGKVEKDKGEATNREMTPDHDGAVVNATLEDQMESMALDGDVARGQVDVQSSSSTCQMAEDGAGAAGDS